MKLGPYYHNLELEDLSIDQLLTLHREATVDFHKAGAFNMRTHEVRRIEDEIKKNTSSIED